jgi:hypothetical protein
MTLIERLRDRGDSLSHEAADKIAALLGQRHTPRIYVSLASSEPDAEPRQITRGPFLNAIIKTRGSGKAILGTTPNDEEGVPTVLALANWNGDGWLLHDGNEGAGIAYDSVCIRTHVPPQ